jgi:hypothetical protein
MARNSFYFYSRRGMMNFPSELMFIVFDKSLVICD